MAKKTATPENDKPTIEYRVRKVERFIITRYEEGPNGMTGSSRQVGAEFSDANTAYEMAMALAGQESQRLGYAPGDERFQFPAHPDEAKAERVE